MTKPGFGSGNATETCSRHQVVKVRLLGIHLRAAYRINYHWRGVCRPEGLPRRRLQPIVVICRHQHQLAPAMSGDLYRLALRLILELAEFALEFHRRRQDHSTAQRELTEYLYIIDYLDNTEVLNT